MEQSIYRVQDFAPIRPHHSFHMNAQLQKLLGAFDIQYGLARSFQREQYATDKERFAEHISKSLSHYSVDTEGYPRQLATDSHFVLADGRTLHLQVETEFENTFLCGNEVVSRLRPEFATAATDAPVRHDPPTLRDMLDLYSTPPAGGRNLQRRCGR